MPVHMVEVMPGAVVGETYIICRKCPDGKTGLGLSYASSLDNVFEAGQETSLVDWLRAHGAVTAAPAPGGDQPALQALGTLAGWPTP